MDCLIIIGTTFGVVSWRDNKIIVPYDPKMDVVLPFWFVNSIMTFVVFLCLGNSYSWFPCTLFNTFFMLNTNDSWLYVKCVQP